MGPCLGPPGWAAEQAQGTTCLTCPAIQSVSSPFSGLVKTQGLCQMLKHSFRFSISEQLLQGLFSLLIYSLLFLKYTQRPLALGTSRTSSPGPEYTLTRLSGTWAKPAGIMGPGVSPSSHQGRPKNPPAPSLGSQR